MLLIVTGTIKPTANDNFLTLSDASERLRQYESSLLFFIQSGAFDKIIFCENSNYGTGCMQSMQKAAVARGISMEALSFQGDAAQTTVHGKGYGEGEIMHYVFSHSKLIQTEPYFIKVTGRLRVDKIKELADRINPAYTYFNIPNRTRRDMYDTRLYAMPAQTFRQFFEMVYPMVNDKSGNYLEKVYTAVIIEHKLPIRNFPKYPRIVGVSGTSGAQYTYVEWKCRIKDILSAAGFYKISR